MRKFITGALAVVFAATLAAAANLTLQSGPQDPSQLLARINQLIRSINSGVNGRLQATVTAAGTTTTVEETLMTYSLPANTLAAPGDAVRVVCWGTTASNQNTKTATLYFGSTTLATNAVQLSPNNKNWRLEALVARNTTTTQNLIGDIAVDVTTRSISVQSPAENLAAAVTIKCTGTTATAVQDLTARGMYIEQVK